MSEEQKADEQKVEWFRHGQTPLGNQLREIAESIDRTTDAIKQLAIAIDKMERDSSNTRYFLRPPEAQAPDQAQAPDKGAS